MGQERCVGTLVESPIDAMEIGDVKLFFHLAPHVLEPMRPFGIGIVHLFGFELNPCFFARCRIHLKHTSRAQWVGGQDVQGLTLRIQQEL